MQQPKYPRTEHERRFLLDHLPDTADTVRIRHITDRYIAGTTLRLRRLRDNEEPAVFKLTQKVPAHGDGFQQGFVTTMYVTESEFCVVAQLPGKELSKTRYSVPPFGIDVFEGALQGLIVAEAEFDTVAEADALKPPPFISQEVTYDERFTGGRLVLSSRQEVQDWLLEYGIRLTPH